MLHCYVNSDEFYKSRSQEKTLPRWLEFFLLRSPLKKNDRIDARKICDCLRCEFLPECYLASTAIRDGGARCVIATCWCGRWCK